MKTTTEEIWFQKEVIEFLRAAPSSFFAAERYEWLKSKAIHDGSRCKYKKSDVMKPGLILHGTGAEMSSLLMKVNRSFMKWSFQNS